MSTHTAAAPQPQTSPAPIRSMTGFALVRRPSTAGELTISLRSVNHRGLDLHFHQLNELALFENAARSLLKQRLVRGHVEVRMSLKRDADPETASYNRDLLSQYLGWFKQASIDFNLDAKPDLNTFFSMPGVSNGAREQKAFDTTFESELLEALASCTDELNAYREREGRHLCLGLEPELAGIEQNTREIENVVLEARAEIRNRLQERICELVTGTAISETRLAEEAALLADRSDIQEELIRLTIHTAELRRNFRAGGEVGKRLDFLLQEMNRETNTILSKTMGAGAAELSITNAALAIKAHIEKIREQALNLE